MNQIPSDAKRSDADPLAVRIQVDSCVDFSSRSSGPETVYVANDRRTGKFYRFGAGEYHVATLMNGQRTLTDIHEQLQREGLLWTPIDVMSFAQVLIQNRLAVIRSADVPSATISDRSKSQDRSAGQDRDAGAADSTRGRPTGLHRYYATSVRLMGGILSQRFPLVDGDRVAAKLLPVFGRVFSLPALLLWLIVVAGGVALVWSSAPAFSLEVRRVFDQQLWLIVAVIWCLLKVVHECGHAVCAKRLGVRVGPMGVLLFLFAPLAYVDVTDAWKLERRRDRVQIALAGIYAELFIGAVAAWIWWLSPVGMTKHLAAQVFLVAGPATLLVNANPLLRLDGYYVLSDLLEIPNLRAHGRARLVAIIERVLFWRPLPTSQLHGWRREFAVLHASCSVVFQVAWISGLLFAVLTWARGIGVLVAIIAVTMWTVLPLLRWMHKIWTLQPADGWVPNHYQRRLITLCMIACLGIEYATLNTSPLARRIPVVVRFQDEQIARAPVDGFVATLFVQCGDRVQRGTLLLELEQADLSLRRDQLADRRDVELAKAVQFRQRGELGLSTAAQQNAESLQRQLDELNDQIASMQIWAQRDGRITTPITDRLLGSYVTQGDELLRVSDPQEKEILAIVAENNLEAYKQAASEKRTASIRLRGGVKISATLTALEPSASRTLPHPALAATVGGPLAVQRLDQAETNELVQPQLRSILPLDALTSLSVQSGQIGRLTIPDNRTLLSRLWDRIERR